MNKGYSLVEIIAVIAILAIIGLIAIPTISSILTDSNEDAYNTQVGIIIESSKKWAVSNNALLPLDNSTYILPLQTLINEGYITNTEDGKMRNPKEGKKYMEGCVSIKYSEEYNQYIYEYVEEC